jgi:hypothetical protein
MSDLSDDKNEIDCCKQALQLIVDLALDYDGYKGHVEGLESLIEELKQLAIDGLHLIRPQYINHGKVYEFINGVTTEVSIERWTTNSKFFVEHFCKKEK